MTATHIVRFVQNDGTLEGKTWAVRTGDVDAALEQYRHEQVSVIAAVYDADGVYEGSAKAGDGYVVR